MNKREKKIIIDRFIQVKNLVEWHEYKLHTDDPTMGDDKRAYTQKRHEELDREALTLGGLAMDLGIWDEAWDAYWDQRRGGDRSY